MRHKGRWAYRSKRDGALQAVSAAPENVANQGRYCPLRQGANDLLAAASPMRQMHAACWMLSVAASGVVSVSLAPVYNAADFVCALSAIR